MALDAQTQRDVAAAKTDRNVSTITAVDDQVLAGDTYALADEGAVIINNRTRIGEIEAALIRLGVIKAA
jgi:hypothetical protein